MSLLSDIEIVNIVTRLYSPQPGDFDHIIQVNSRAAYIGVKYGDGVDFVIARGSQTPDDWLRDIDSEISRSVTEYPQLGHLPYGFGEFLPETYAAVAASLRRFPVIFAGHSLGAAEAPQLAGVHLIKGNSVALVAQFEPPRPGTETLKALLAPIPIHAYRNQGDPVCDVPVPVPPLLPWTHMRDFLELDVGPEPSTADPLARHHIGVVVAGVTAYRPSPLSA